MMKEALCSGPATRIYAFYSITIECKCINSIGSKTWGFLLSEPTLLSYIVRLHH